MTDPAPLRVTAVMLAWGEEPILEEAVTAVLRSTGVAADVVLVDNGCTSDAVERVRHLDGVSVVTPGTNTGFAGGCNVGATHATGDYLAFINGDAVVDHDALAHLVHALADDVALSSASLRLYDEPDTMNSAGNPVHFSGLSWAGGLGDAAHLHAESTDVPSASGAATAVRADRFEALGGFCAEMFAYCEDTELSLRCWQRGWRVVYVPEAVVRHHYEFSRNEQKLYLLERNRLFMVLTIYERWTLAVLAPALFGLELAVLAVAVRQGWWRQKAAGWRWLWRNRDVVRSRRRQVQGVRTRSDREMSGLLTGDFAPGAEAGFSAPAFALTCSRSYWSIAKRCLARRRTRVA